MEKIKKIGGTVTPANGWVDLEKWNGHPASHIPDKYYQAHHMSQHISTITIW